MESPTGRPNSSRGELAGSMGRLVRFGWHTARERMALVGIGLLLSWIAAFLFAGFSWVWLARALGDSLPTRTLLAELDVHVAIDLLVHHRHSLHMLLGQGVLIAAIGLGAWIWLQATTALAVSSKGSLRECAAFGRAYLGRYMLLWLTSAATVVISLAIVLGLVRWLETSNWIELSTGRQLLVWGVGAAMAVAVYVVATTWHDHARIHLATADTSTAPGMLWALRFVLRNGAQALSLTGLCLLGNALLLWMYHWSSSLAVGDAALRVPVAFALGQAWMILRIFLRLWLVGAAAALQAREEGSSGSEQLALLPLE